MKHLAGILSAVLVSAVIFTGCGGGGGGGSSTPADTTPPDILYTIPVADAKYVDIDQEIVLIFSEAMDSSTINTTNYYMSGGAFGAVSYNPATHIATLTPASSMSYATTYTVTITADVADSAGNTLSGGYAWSFRSEPDTYAPVVTSVNPANGATEISTNITSITATFNESMAGGTITNSTFTVSGLTGTVSYNNPTYTATFTPSGQLLYGQAYTAALSTAVTDTAGNPLASTYQWTFTSEVDVTPPTVTSVNPIDGAAGISRSATITAVFSEDMAASTINTTTFTVSGVTGSVFYDALSNKVTFTPSGLMPYNTLHTATITTGAQDLYGNAVASDYVWTFRTEVDTIPPAVSSTNPINDQSLTSVHTRIKAVFSESMAPGSINSSTFTVSGVTGTVTYDNPTLTATFNPGSPLNYLNNYMVSLSTGITDAQGIPLTSQYQWGFDTVEQALKISGYTPSDMKEPALAFKGNGDGIAVWMSGSGGNYNGYRVIYSLYTESTQTWSTESVLASSPKGSSPNVHVETNGTGYLVVWSVKSSTSPYYELLAGVYVPGSGWSVTTLANEYASSPQLASNGSGYAVVWNQSNLTPTWSAVYSGTSWTVTLFSPGSLSGLQLATNGTTYSAAYYYNKYVYATVYSGSSWPTATMIFNPTGGYYVTSLDLTSNGSGFAAVWSYYSGYFTGTGAQYQTHAAVYSGGAWSGSTQIIPGSPKAPTNPLITSNGSGYSTLSRYSGTAATALYSRNYTGQWDTLNTIALGSSMIPLGLVSNGTGYAAAFLRGSKTSGDLAVNVYNGSSWIGSTTLDTTGTIQDVSLVSSPPSYNIVWGKADGSGPYSSIFGGAAWSSPFAIDSSANPAKDPILVSATIPAATNRYVAAWSQSDTINVRHYRAGWQPTQNIIAGSYPGNAMNPRIASTTSGLLMAVWEQYSGEYKAVYASYRAGTAGAVWSVPFEVAAQGETPDVANYGSNNFVVVWENTDLADRGIKSRRYNISTGLWNPAVTVKSALSVPRNPRITTKGIEYLIVWEDSDVYLSTSTDYGTTWTTPFKVSTGGGQKPQIVSNGTGYFIAYTKSGFSNDIMRGRVFNGTTWDAEKYFGNVSAYYLYTNKSYGIATDGTGYAITWEYRGIYTATYNGATWSSNVQVSTFPPLNIKPNIAWDGSEYLVLWKRGINTYASVFNGASWSAQTMMPDHGALGLASNGTGFATLYLKNDGTYSSVASHYYKNGEWGGGDGYVERLRGDASTPVVIRWGKSYYAGAWGRSNEFSVAGEIWSIRGY